MSVLAFLPRVASFLPRVSSFLPRVSSFLPRFEVDSIVLLGVVLATTIAAASAVALVRVSK